MLQTPQNLDIFTIINSTEQQNTEQFMMQYNLMNYTEIPIPTGLFKTITHAYLTLPSFNLLGNN